MVAKYKMTSPQDYRGNVKTIYRGLDGIEWAYTNVEVLDIDMIAVSDQEITDRGIEIEVTPTTITMRQARLVLIQMGLYDTVQAAIGSMDQAVQVEWEYATEVHRDNVLVTTLASQLGLSDTDLDNMFLEASKL